MSNFKVILFLVYYLSKRRYLLVDRGIEYSKKKSIICKSVKYLTESKRHKMFKINVDHVGIACKVQERDLNNNPINSDNLFYTCLTGTKKMCSY
jgi:hypothetical protein